MFLLDKCYLRLDYDKDKQESKPSMQWELVKKLEVRLIEHKKICNQCKKSREASREDS